MSKFRTPKVEQASQMSLVDKSFRSRKAIQYKGDRPHVPMGDERFRQLMNEMSAAFARADDGEEVRRQARERERLHEQWQTRREETIVEIVAIMRQYGLSIQDIL